MSIPGPGYYEPPGEPDIFPCEGEQCSDTECRERDGGFVTVTFQGHVPRKRRLCDECWERIMGVIGYR